MENKLSTFNFPQPRQAKRGGQLSTQRGFTLIEILIVCSIIGILAALIFTNFNVIKRSRDAQRKSDLKKIASALENYRADNGRYPSASSFKLPANCPPTGSKIFFGNNTGTPPCSITYLKSIPKDPNGSTWWNSGNYYYSYDSSAGSYNLVACIENTSDPEQYKLFDIYPFNLCPFLNGYLVSSP